MQWPWKKWETSLIHSLWMNSFPSCITLGKSSSIKSSEETSSQNILRCEAEYCCQGSFSSLWRQQDTCGLGSWTAGRGGRGMLAKGKCRQKYADRRSMPSSHCPQGKLGAPTAASRSSHDNLHVWIKDLMQTLHKSQLSLCIRWAMLWGDKFLRHETYLSSLCQ